MPQKITLRKKPIKEGEMLSLYLDYSPPAPHSKTGEIVRKEYLGLYVWAPQKIAQRKGRAEKEIFDSNPITNQERTAHNSEQLAIATAILTSRQNVLNKPEIFNSQEKQALEAEKKGQASFVEFFAKQCEFQILKGQYNYFAALQYYKRFTNGKQISFSEITTEHCENFKLYLLKTVKAEKLDHNTASQYFKFFRTAINAADLQDFLQKNPIKKVKSIKLEKREKEFLTIKELERLNKTECSLPDVKRACLFAALTGERASDVINLTWQRVVKLDENKYSLNIVVKKGKLPTLKPISSLAVKFLGERGKDSAKVFDVKYHQLSPTISAWVKAAGINKKITFHNFRHSFVSNLYLGGAGITEVSKLVGHSTPNQTLNTYSHLTPERMRDTVETLTLNLD